MRAYLGWITMACGCVQPIEYAQVAPLHCQASISVDSVLKWPDTNHGQFEKKMVRMHSLKEISQGSTSHSAPSIPKYFNYFPYFHEWNCNVMNTIVGYVIAEFYYNVYRYTRARVWFVDCDSREWCMRVVYLLSDRCQCALADKAWRK
jgi:hypothetical protein